MKPKSLKRAEAEARQELRDRRSDREQIAILLRERPGASNRERDRLALRDYPAKLPPTAA